MQFYELIGSKNKTSKSEHTYVLKLKDILLNISKVKKKKQKYDTFNIYVL